MNIDHLIACPQCDVLHEIDETQPLERTACTRCHTVLIAPRRRAGLKIIALAFVSLLLVAGALFFPFLTIKRFWFSNHTTLIDVVLAFEGPLLAMALIVSALVIALPLARLLLTLYVLLPLVGGANAWPGAKRAFRISEALKPWSMAEIFVIGCAIALIKVVDLAKVELGVAFWLFGVLVVLIYLQNTLMCRFSVWRDLDR